MKFFLFALLSISFTLGQSINGNSIVLSSSNLPKVNTASVSVQGTFGSSTYYYWIVANFVAGQAPVGGPFVVTNANSVLSVTNFNRVNWNGISGASSYDLLRVSIPGVPGSGSNIAVATGITATTYNDIVPTASLTTYNFNTINNAQANISINNLDYLPARVILDKTWMIPTLCFYDGTCQTTAGGGGSGTIIEVNGQTGPIVNLTVNNIAGAVSESGNNDYLGENSFLNATKTIPFRSVATVPLTCDPGEMMFLASDYTTYNCINGVPQLLTNPSVTKLQESDEFAWYNPGTSTFAGNMWRLVGGACGGGLVNVASETNHPGILRMTTSGAAFDICALGRHSAANEYVVGLNGKTFDETWIIRTGSDVTNTSLYVGWLLGGTISNTNSMYFRYDTAAGDTAIVGRTCVASVCTNTSTVVAIAANTWFKLRMRSTTPGTVIFSGCSGEACTLGTEQSLASVPSVGLSPGFLLQAATASVKTIDIDYYNLSTWISR